MIIIISNMIKNSLLVLIVLFNISTQYEVTTIDDIFILNDTNFNDFKNDSEYLFALFTSGECQNCPSVIPEFISAGGEFKNTNVKFGRYDSSEDQRYIIKELNIRSFPTILFFQKNKPYVRYLGVRIKDSFITYLRRSTTPKLRELSTCDEIKNLVENLKGDEFIIIHFGDKNLDQFLINIEQIDNANFAFCKLVDCISKYIIRNGSAILFKPFDNKQVTINSGYSIDKLLELIENEGIPSHVNLDDKYLDLIIKKKKPALVFFYNLSNKDKYIEFASELGPKLKGTIQVIYSGYNQTLEDSKLVEYFKIKGEDKKLPFISILDPRGPRPKFFRFQESDLNERKITKLVKDWERNNLNYDKVSEQIPITQKGPVMKLVSLNFEKLTKQSNENIFVRYYDSSNQNKEESKLFNSLALKYNNKIIFAQIDLSKNDINLVIKKLPSYHLWLSKNIKFVEYKMILNEVSFDKLISEYIAEEGKTGKDDL